MEDSLYMRKGSPKKHLTYTYVETFIMKYYESIDIY